MLVFHTGSSMFSVVRATGTVGGTTEQISANHSCFWGACSKFLCLYEINNKASQITNANGKLRTLERGSNQQGKGFKRAEIKALTCKV